MASSDERDVLQVFFPGKSKAPILSLDHRLPVMIDNSMAMSFSAAPSTGEIESNFDIVGT